MTRARRSIALFAAASALAAIPGAAAAQPVSQCVDPETEPVVYVCVTHDPEYGTDVLFRVDDTKYSLWRDENGLHFCSSGSFCPLP